MSPLALSLVAFGLSSLGSAGLLLRRRTAVVAAVLLGASGAAMIVTAVVLANGTEATAMVVGTGGVSVLLVLAVATFPRVRWRHPVDFMALVVLGGCGLVGTVWPLAREVEGLIQGTVLVAYLWWRVETSSGRERRAVVWMAATVALSSLLFATLTFAAEETINGWALGILFALIGPAMYVGATLPDIVDLRSLVVTATVFAVAVVTYMAVFVIMLALLEAAGAQGLSVGTTALVGALVAATFAPTQSAMRGVVEELLFGVRLDPLGAASAVAGTIGDDPVRALRAIRESLNLPYAALLVDGAEVAVSGARPALVRTLDLDGGGSLVVGHRPGDQRLTAADEQVLRLTVPLLAQTLRAHALAAELHESRGRTIAAVEDERRRLRRDLHDGLGPRLSGVAFTADAARNLIRVDPGAAEEMVAQLRADTVTAIEEIRRMVYAMRPPALDELGLVPALRQQAIGMRNRDGRPVAVSVSASELPDLPAAVEVAAYRIATEALANVARHSTSPSATVRIDAEQGELHIEVTDTGTSDGWRPGVGLSSMRERATELGGTLSAGPGPHGGTVTAVLPLRA